MRYAIAYSDKDANGFGELPFILDEFDNYDDAARRRSEMCEDGYRDVLCFKLREKHPEEITWEYVISNVANKDEKTGRCAFCELFIAGKKWPMQCKLRGMLHPDECPSWKLKR